MNEVALSKLIKAALEEDLPTGDLTTDLILSSDSSTTAHIISKDTGIFFGETIIHLIFQICDPEAVIHLFKHDGDPIQSQDKICEIHSSVKTILQVERVMLNFIQRLSGIATLTNKFVEKLNNNRIKIVDTRKTTPLLRTLEKQAILAGGGYNHRHNLSDMILIKENHISQLAKEGQVDQLPHHIKTFKKHNPDIKIELEVESLSQVKAFDFSDVDIIMFDNFQLPELKESIDYCKKNHIKSALEVSGNISLDTIHHYSELGIDRIAVGSLTHSIKSVDLSLLLH